MDFFTFDIHFIDLYNSTETKKGLNLYMIYGYVRVSSTSQNIDRQLKEMEEFKIPFKNIFIDKQSGKDFDRKNYQRLIKKIKSGDLIIIKSIDRLGRNYEMILEEWKRITHIVGADIVVIDMPLLDTRTKEDNLIGRFVSDIVLQILSFVAENERDYIKQRQKEGIALAKAKGIHLGRPSLPLPTNFFEVASDYKKKNLNNNEDRKLLNMSKGTFYRNLKKYGMS